MARIRTTDFSPSVMAIEETINNLSTEEMSAVYEMLKDRRDVLARSVTRSLTVGARVEFDGKRGVVVSGTVSKINRKSVIVIPEGASQYNSWRVSPTLLRVI